VPPTVSTLPATTLYRNVATDGSKTSELVAPGFRIGAQRRPDGSQEVALRTPEGVWRALHDSTSRTTVVVDETLGSYVLSESGPRGTVIRLFNARNEYQSGYFIEFGTGGKRTLWQLRSNGTTEPANLTNGRALPAAPAPSPKPAPEAPREATSGTDADSCYSMMQDITGGGAAYADEIGEAYDQDENPQAVRRVGRLGRFLHGIWSNVPRLCADAPDPVSDSTFGKERMLEAIRAIGPEGLRNLIDRYNSYRDFIDENLQRAQLLRQAFNQLTSTQRTQAGSSTPQATTESGSYITPNPASSLAATVGSTAPVTVYVGASLSCLGFDAIPGSSTASPRFRFRNNCGYDITVKWCFGPTVCTLSSLRAITTGGSYEEAWLSSYSIWYASCPATYQGRAVFVTQPAGTSKFYCSYTR